METSNGKYRSVEVYYELEGVAVSYKAQLYSESLNRWITIESCPPCDTHRACMKWVVDNWD